ncbi:hypothetical protein OJF2_05240 [Aquisphaera giovannonii]|uniref:Ice-binding protein C-terminal domain-containing protein n=1 Tax=Aquisphaera giovannonii TaxID=406548 RepID=A0A5B9VW99_9BACT|nr:PEP-CTERM sorting domain-containing protein [Aquisphaera giovannonii]QEH32055.1 hypothetical protein OJF2_05240 [Aquisphaera giovannonii]
MIRRSRRTKIAAALLVLIAATAAEARSEVIVSFSYSGRGGPDFAGLIATGTGSFAFAEGLTTIGLADLTSFHFVLDENTPNTATFGLADLSSFSASMGPGLTLTGLSLGTDAVQGDNPSTEPREFDVASLDPSGASTSYRIVIVSFQQTVGTVTITSVAVPEPSTIALVASGAPLAFLGIRSRRRAARAAA